MSKTRSLDELKEIVVCQRSNKKRVILCHGVFDLLHPGHLRHFKEAKKLGDILIVSVTPDRYVNKGPGRPIYSEELRIEFIASLECVDYVVINKWPTAVEIIKLLQPDVYAKGSDYADMTKDFSKGILMEQEAVRDVGGVIHFTEGITFSSSSILNKYFDIYPEQVRVFLDSFRKKYSVEDVIGLLNSLKNSKVLVIGETILDEYHHVAAIGKPPKGTHIAARYLNQEVHAGGILACANHIAGFCGEVDLLTVIGNKDESEKFIRTQLKSNINPIFYYQDHTIIKRRYIDYAYSSKLFEIYENDLAFSGKVSDSVSNWVAENVGNGSGKTNYDLILVLDYGHNLFTSEFVNTVCGLPCFLAVNTQTNTSNLGYNLITKYPRANYFCLDEPELRLAYQDRLSDVRYLAQSLGKRLSVPGMISVTRGHVGAMTYKPQSDEFFEAPVLSQKIIDTTGAGDAFLAITAPCVARNFPIDLVAFIGNAVGSLAVGYLGNKSSIEPTLLYKFITAMLK